MRRPLFLLALCLGLAWVGRAPAQTEGEGQLKSLQQRIESDPTLMDKVKSLQNDDDVAAVLSDPDIAAAIERGDFGVLLANPKVGKLMSNPTVREIARDVNP
ncbi:MAG: hypothetical protein ACRERC_00320 [Candidatus Binatia bacterium]